MKVIQGNLLHLAEQGHFDVILHGCNCFNTMGAGIAKQIKQRYPSVALADAQGVRGDYDKLGTVEFVNVGKFLIGNAYTQYRYGGKQVDYNAIRSCFRQVSEIFKTARIGYPKIGAGLAGGDWKIISSIIDEELEGMDHTVVIL